MEPTATLGDPSQSLASSFSLPLANSATTFSGFSTASDGFDFGSFVGTQVRAPANGLVVGVDTSAQTVTLLHNVRVFTRIRGVTSSVQVGNYLAAGTQIGTVGTSSVLRFSVIVDGALTCPLSFLNSAARTQLATTFPTIVPCAI
jgi:murein DD-endopeptidase MepM/ murein hydrolase activator NlpD